jgi:uncharacterized membrane protein (UPF0136 family)
MSAGLRRVARTVARIGGRWLRRALWLALALTLLFLGINKQLDLQTALTETGRIVARAQGWYAGRRKVQVLFILGVLLGSAWLFRAAFLLGRGSAQRMGSVLAGTVFLLCFVAIRASSFHHVDWLLGTRLARFKVNWILELGGIALVIHGARNALRGVGPAGGGPRQPVV